MRYPYVNLRKLAINMCTALKSKTTKPALVFIIHKAQTCGKSRQFVQSYNTLPSIRLS